MSKEIAEEYASSLSDLTVNSKPLINMLTILAEENIDHAGVIVETVEKHLEKVNPDIKLPVLYLVDSIIKNVGGAYTTKFSQSIVNMFTRTFKQVDEKVRSQMFKLRETWHDVFPATKLYQLDVKVNLIDPAWPIQAQPQQSNIHVNPNFLKKTATTSAVVVPKHEEDEKMRSILAKKEQELLMLQKKKVEMELEQMRRQLDLEKTVKKSGPLPSVAAAPSIPVAVANSVVAPSLAPPALPAALLVPPEVVTLSAKQRLGPPVSKPAGASRIAPVSAALATARRDPRLARHGGPPGSHTRPSIRPVVPPVAPPVAPPLVAPPPPNIAPNVFDIKPLERVTKRKNVITIDVRPDAGREVRRRDPRLDKSRDPRRDKTREKRREERPAKPVPEDVDKRRKETEKEEKDNEANERNVDDYMDKLHIVDPKRINRLPPIPKKIREEIPEAPPAPKRKKESVRDKKKKREDSNSSKDSSSGSSPEKRLRAKESKKKPKEPAVEAEQPDEPSEETVAFKELKNYHKERYMRRNKEKSESPEKLPEKENQTEVPPPPENDSSNVPEVVVENKDIDLRVLPAVDTKPAVVAQKRSSTEMTVEGKPKKNKMDKFDILFGNEDVDLRQLPQVEEIAAPPPPSITECLSPKSPKKPKSPEPSPMDEEETPLSPKGSPKKDWNEVKEKKDKEEVKKTPSKLDLVRAKLAEATKGKDRLGRPLLFSKSPSIERERRRTLSSDDTDMRSENGEDFDTEDHKKTISIIMSQAKEQFSDGQLDKNQYNALMYQVLQLNEKLKLKEAKQRESLEISKRKLKAHTKEEHKVSSPKSSPSERNRFGDIDERMLPSVFLDTPPDSQGFMQDSDMRNKDGVDGHPGLLPRPPTMPMFGPNMPNMPNIPFPPVWRGQHRPRTEEFAPRRFRGPVPPFFRPKFDTRGPRGPFDMPPMPMPPLPMPQIGICQGDCPLQPYERSESPPPLGAPGFVVPPTDFKVIEYIDQDPVKTIQIDGIPREIRFYDNTAVIMLDWDDPREIKFLPGCRRVTFDNKDSVVLSFNEGYKQVEIEDQVFDIKFGAPTRELYINRRWHECFFGGSPLGVIIEGKPRLVHLEGPLPQVDIGKEKRTDLVAGKINLIVNATQMCPVYLDAKVQKFVINNQVFTIRFVDALRTVLINEQPFKVEFGDLPKPIFIGNEKHFIRFSALPRNIKPGFVQIAQMEGCGIPTVPLLPITKADSVKDEEMETDEVPPVRPVKTPSPDQVAKESQGLDMLASVMPTSMELASGSDYSLAEPLFTGAPDKIPGLETAAEEKPPLLLPVLGNINVTDLFAKLVATGIVQVQAKPETKDSKVEEAKQKQQEVDKSVIHKVDLLRPETLRVAQPGVVSRLYGGMQCSGCGARFPPEHTVRYSQHLDWHFRTNRRERDSARRAHSRHWHYDLGDWLHYEELDEQHDREKNWFENGGGGGSADEGEAPPEVAVETPSVAAGAPADCLCAMCGDKFDQFYNEDQEEWHLRNSVRHEDQNYHPMCFEDYKASLTKEELPQELQDDVVTLDKTEEAIVIKDVEDDSTLDDQSDNESVVEVVEEEPEKPQPMEPEEPLEIDEGEEDDVIYKAEPVEEVLVEDEVETDDETQEKRAERDRQAEIDFSIIKIKQEPVDPDDEPIITEEENITPAVTENSATHATTSVLSSIDGNVQLDAAPAPVSSIPLGGIRINISKSTIPTFISNSNDHMLHDISADDEPLPPGEEPELEYKLKPGLEEVQFSRQPPLSKGNELSGLCSIM